RMQTQDLFTAIQVRPIYQNVPVKTTRAEQSRIQNLWSVRSREDTHPLARIETVHLDQQLIERLFTFIVPSHERGGTTRLAPPIEFIDEDNTRGLGFGLRKEIAHARRAYPNNH